MGKWAIGVTVGALTGIGLWIYTVFWFLPSCTTCEIAFTSSRDGNDEVYVMDADGGNPTRLTTDPSSDNNPAWSPDGSKIAFTSHRDGNSEIYVMDADGGNPTRLTFAPSVDFSPAWSPDGSKIVFTSNRDHYGPEADFEIYVMDADGGNPTRLTTYLAADLMPAWSPDGIRIAFVSTRDGAFGMSSEIYVMDADGGNQTRLTFPPVMDEDVPAWVFAGFNGDPVWSPDGSKIAFFSDRAGNAEIFVMDADGGNPTRLTVDQFDFGQLGSQFDFGPAWSPSGSWIAFAHGSEENAEVWVMDAYGGNRDRLTWNLAGDYEPSWRPFKPPGTTASAGTVFPMPTTTTTPSTTKITTSPPTTTTTTQAVATTTTVLSCAPEAPVLLQPVDESSVDEALPEFRWAYRGEQPCVLSGQRFELAVDEAFDGEVLSEELGPDVTEWMPESDLEDCTLYFWRVVAADTGPVSFSETWSFETNFPNRSGTVVCP